MDNHYYITLTKVTGILVVAQQSRQTYTGTPEQLEAIYKKVLTHNLVFGWWGIFALVWNIIAISRNLSARKALRQAVTPSA